MLTSNKDKNKRYSIPFFRLIFTGETHGIFIEENEESVASESDADSFLNRDSFLDQAFLNRDSTVLPGNKC